MPLISILLTSYNHKQFLPEAINSILNQIFQDFELIIVDDYSTDNSRQIIKKYANLDKRIKPIFHERNLGVASCLNDALKIARGKFIALIDSDDIWVKTKLKEQLEILQKNENLIIWNEGKLIDQYGTPIGITFTQKYNATDKKKSGNIFLELIKQNFILKSSLIFKKDNLNGLRFNEKLRILDDYVFEVAMAKKYSFYFIEKPLTKYRIHEKNITLKSDILLKEIIIVNKFFTKIYGKYLPKDLHYELNFKLMEGSILLNNFYMALKFALRSFKFAPIKFMKKINFKKALFPTRVLKKLK